jgi:hypothetical protein
LREALTDAEFGEELPQKEDLQSSNEEESK